MAEKKENKLFEGKGEGGRWVTINGAHVFVDEEQSIEEAMNDKFEKPSTAKNKEQEGAKHSASRKYPYTLFDDDEIVGEYQDEGCHCKNVIFKARNGKYFNVYGADTPGAHQVLASYESLSEAKKWMKKHRPRTKMEEKEEKRFDDYGNEMLDSKTRQIGVEAGKKYLAELTQWGQKKEKVLNSNYVVKHMKSLIGEAISNSEHTGDYTLQDEKEILEEIGGYKVDDKHEKYIIE